MFSNVSTANEAEAKSTQVSTSKEKNPAAESFLTELDAPTSDPIQPPIIRFSQTTPANLSKVIQSSTSSSDRKVSFNLEKVTLNTRNSSSVFLDFSLVYFFLYFLK